jgi:hypothetical protein
MLFQDKYTFKIQKQTTFKANMRENVIEFNIYIYIYKIHINKNKYAFGQVW